MGIGQSFKLYFEGEEEKFILLSKDEDISKAQELDCIFMKNSFGAKLHRSPRTGNNDTGRSKRRKSTKRYAVPGKKRRLYRLVSHLYSVMHGR